MSLRGSQAPDLGLASSLCPRRLLGAEGGHRTHSRSCGMPATRIGLQSTGGSPTAHMRPVRPGFRPYGGVSALSIVVCSHTF